MTEPVYVGPCAKCGGYHGGWQPCTTNETALAYQRATEVPPRREDAGDEKPMDYRHPLEMHHARREDAAGADECQKWLGMTPALRAGEDELARLCAGRGHTTARGLAGRDWTMCIPVQRDDSDVIFSNVLIECRTAHERIAELEAALSTAERERDELKARLAPCGECHLQPNERCDICGKVQDA